MSSIYSSLADAVLVLHLGVVLFVVFGLLLIVAGNLLRWAWVNRLSFRLAHLAAIAWVVAQQWLGADCPLTTFESWLRVKAGEDGYAAGFIEDWASWLLFYEAPGWVFTLAYTAFALAVAAAWIFFPPRRGPRLRGG
jgi:hypothetical protein